jgi:hypothetical protein
MPSTMRAQPMTMPMPTPIDTKERSQRPLSCPRLTSSALIDKAISAGSAIVVAKPIRKP